MLKKILARFKTTFAIITNINVHFDEIKINQGIILSQLNENKKSRRLEDYEFKIFSQWGEDGIIQYLTKSIEIKNKTFIEFGVEDFIQANCRFLLMKDDWKGFVIDSSKNNISRLQSLYFYWKYELNSLVAYITKENINDLLSKSGFKEDLGILSIDLDGNDYYILQAIENFKPRILICEYNAVFGEKRKISIPYQPDFNRTKSHYSNLYWGASLAAMTFLANKKGYSLVGTNSACLNAFYIRNDLINSKVEVLTVEDSYFPSSLRESRDKLGNKTYITGNERLDVIRGLQVYEVEKQILEVI